MRAFISYSLNDSEQYVLSILARKLKEQGFIVSSSYNTQSNLIDFQTYSQLNKSSLFIGVITYNGTDITRVYNEWKTALEKRIPAILLIEDIVAVGTHLQNHPNIIRFNRSNPETSIEVVKQKINKSKQTNWNVQPRQQTNDNTAAWVFGGIAALAIISLLSKK